MKLRIKGNSIRLRLSQTEVSTFQDKGEVKENVTFPSGELLSYTLKRHDGSEFKAELLGGNINILVPADKATIWFRDDQVGMNSSVQITDNQELMILVEKDFACLAVRENEDESDNFPNPNLAC